MLWIILVIVAIVVAIVVLSLVMSLKSYKRRFHYFEEESQNLRDRVEALNKTIIQQESEKELMKELIFFLQLGHAPSRDKRREMANLMENSVKFLEKNRTEYPKFNPMLQQHLNETDRKLADMFKAFADRLCWSADGGFSLYPKLADYICRFGLDFCGRREWF